MTDQTTDKVAYAYDAQTGEYLGEVYADPDPLTPDHWLLPAHATFEAPIGVDEDQVAVWKQEEQAGAWQSCVDLRGTAYWDEEGNAYEISELGGNLPDWALLTEPEAPVTLEAQTALANDECTRRIDAKWNRIGQTNVSLGLYTAAEQFACKQWIVAHLVALEALLAREDLLDIDVTDDAYWQLDLEAYSDTAETTETADDSATEEDQDADSESTTDSSTSETDEEAEA
ncbi:hypothetical protein [Marinomonas aquiplantarum]|uniref:Virus tail fiber assembly protein lambda gpK n=1 Tax=Marinomonas aquiplantarum TaxID=491951 RepID=A0A366D8X2_9GAMM|nr:hypothetical protein [Marinomonas aquiplantarum]RBO85904.1 hypothetical protein DFP76_101179 [Marinomonas aquiplantarum]